MCSEGFTIFLHCNVQLHFSSHVSATKVPSSLRLQKIDVEISIVPVASFLLPTSTDKKIFKVCFHSKIDDSRIPIRTEKELKQDLKYFQTRHRKVGQELVRRDSDGSR
ncbi:uncharacterized protein [Henckelia pumila]|uniref:uncharacterized protein n=1 Tax=Henckelia pumila TaxID=405737 RepID=UPI003C6E5FF7